MSSLTTNVSPLRQRMIDDMRMRKFDGKTQIHYIRAVRRLAAFLRRSPDTATAEELRAFQLHMVDTGTAPPTINATLSGLKFFFDVTLAHAELLVKVQPVHQPRPLPVVLSCDEVARLIAAAPNPKYQAALSVAYGAGQRAAEVCALKVAGSARWRDAEAAPVGAAVRADLAWPPVPKRGSTRWRNRRRAHLTSEPSSPAAPGLDSREILATASFKPSIPKMRFIVWTLPSLRCCSMSCMVR